MASDHSHHGLDGFDVFAGGGEVGADLARVDWAATALGPPSEWPRTLATAVRIVLTSRFSMWMAWGPDLTFFCNDAYRRDTLATKYPWALGRPAQEVWAEIWDDIGPRIASVLESGVATWDDTLMLFLERSGYREETYHTFSYSPLADDSGANAGMLCVVTEETERALGQRRLATLRELSAGLADATTEDEVLATVEAVFGAYDLDLPFTSVYLLDADGAAVHRVASTGRARSRRRSADDGPLARMWPIDQLVAGHEIVTEVGGWFDDALLPMGGWDRPAEHAILVPLRTTRDRRTTGVFVAGFNPYRPADETAIGFARLVAGYIASAVGTAHAFDEERQRRQALEDLDRVKTQFFANVSHELRTPLTLITGPLRELRHAIEELGDPELEADIEIIERNGTRLTKLVNTLLDVSRLQAGRADPTFQPVELGAFTSELAETFRGAVEHAGLRFLVDISEPDARAYVDPDMWEKVVLNLLSNALKFTFAGEIGVSLRAEGGRAVLRVTDTGVGIPEAELAHVFDRFHRIPTTRARSVEGSGIGLALVSELVGLHGGTVAVTSALDAGSTFTVAIPLGAEHLDATLVSEATSVAAPVAAESFLAETRMWFDERPAAGRADDDPDADPDADDRRARRGEVLVADDNPDMRAYIARVLDGDFAVRTVTNGAEALAALRSAPCDLVLSDVMMPEVDGYELLRTIRADPELADIPVVLLTAHAGSAAELHGLNLGADDYLVKPFAAEDLRGRVAARLAAGAERRQRQAVSELARQLLRATDPKAIVATAHSCIARWLGAANASLALLDDDHHLVRMWHHPPYEGGVNARYKTAAVDAARPLVAPLNTGEIVVLENVDDVARQFPETVEDFALANRQAMVVVPLVRATGEMNGTLAASWSEPRAIAPSDIALLGRAGAAITDAMERLRVTEQEHRVFLAFQEQLLAIDHHAATGIVAARYEPATEDLLVGGDWYDVITLPDGALGLSIGDAVGKGLPAARVMAQLRSAVGAAATASDSPAQVIGMVDDYSQHLPDAAGTTLAYLRLPPDGTITWAAAGHPPPVVARHGRAELLTGATQPPLGAVKARAAVEQAVQLRGPALVLLYTDGILERRGESLTVGFERLCTAVERLAHLPLRTLVDQLVREMEPPGGYRDDVALLAVGLPGSGPFHFVDAYPAVGTELARARARLREWLHERDLAVDDIDDLVLAVGEASTNAFEHGSAGNPRSVIGLEVCLRGRSLTAAVTDAGSWDEDSARSQREGRGRGFAMMELLVDRVEVDHSHLGTCVVLHKELRGAPTAVG